MIRKWWYSWLLMMGLLGGVAAQEPAADDAEVEADRRPTLSTGGTFFLKDATLLTVANGTIAKGSLLVENGKIARIGRDLQPPPGVLVLEGAGYFVMPGIIDCHSHIAIEGGINEGSQSIVAEVRIDDEVDHRSLSIYRALAGGTTAANLLHGSANVIGGQNAVVKMRYGKTAKEMLFEGAPRGIKFALGENPKRSGSPRDRASTPRYPATRMGVEAVLRRAFTEAQDYRAEWQRFETARSAGEERVAPRRDLRLETLVDILEGRVLVHSHCYRADEILMLMRVAEDFGFRIRTLQHVLEGFKVAPEIVRHGAMPSTFSDWWAYKIEAYDAIPYNAALLTRAGAITSVNSDSGDLIRRLYHEAAKSLRYGNLSADECLALVTLNPARQLGIDHRVGSLEVGKDADLALFNGHPLSVYSRCEYTFVDGECYFQRGRERIFNATGPDFEPHPFPLPSELPVPGAGGLYAITHATLYPVVGEPIADGTLVIRDGRIEALGSEVAVPVGAEVIDASGLSVYPGLFDAATSVGLGEIGSIQETSDQRELGRNEADLRVTAAVHPDSAHIPVARADGVTTVAVLPGGSMIAGQAAIMQMDGWTWEQMTVQDRAALVVSFPMVRDEDDPAEALGKGDIQELSEWLAQARRHAELREGLQAAGQPLPPSDSRLEALAPFARGEKLVMIQARGINQIRAAVLFAEKESLDYVLVGVSEGWRVAEFLAEHGTRCLVGPVLATPRRSDERYDAPFQNPARLHAAGVPLAIVSQGQENVRQLGHHAGMAAAFGLPRDIALEAVTLRPAQFLGVADRLGSLEPGKWATLLVTDGDPLEYRTHVHYEFIAGRPVSLESKHTRLYERYLQRLAAPAGGGEQISPPLPGAQEPASGR